MRYILSLVVSFLIVYFITPWLMKLFNKYSFTDKPTKRKKHDKETPLCGGVAMFIGFFIVYFLVNNYTLTKEKILIFIGSFLILAIGLVDDFYKSRGKEFPIYPRLIIQLIAAFIIYNAGIVFRGFTNPFTGNYIVLSSFVQFILTITWLVSYIIYHFCMSSNNIKTK